MNETQIAKLQPVLDTLGLRGGGKWWRKNQWSPKFAWDGQRLDLRIPASGVCHEIGHWLVAAPAARALRDFDEPDIDDEILASLLGMLIQRQFKVGYWRRTWDEHNWTGEAISTLKQDLKKLRERGLIECVGSRHVLRLSLGGGNGEAVEGRRSGDLASGN